MTRLLAVLWQLAGRVYVGPRHCTSCARVTEHITRDAWELWDAARKDTPHPRMHCGRPGCHGVLATPAQIAYDQIGAAA